MRRSCSRSFTVALLIVATFTERLITQETPAGSAVTIVLDLPSPVVDEESIRLTRGLLSELQGGLVRYFSLSIARIEEISAGAVHDLVGQEVTKNEASTETHLEALAKIVAIRPRGSGMALVQLSDDIWLMARRALTVDGKHVAVESPRLDLARSEQEALARLRNLAQEGASWNIGGVRRNINPPTLALWFLTPAVVDRFRFESAGTNASATRTTRGS